MSETVWYDTRRNRIGVWDSVQDEMWFHEFDIEAYERGDENVLGGISWRDQYGHRLMDPKQLGFILIGDL